MNDDLLRLLQPFCSPERGRLNVPFSQGSFTYATDQRIIIRVPRIESVTARGPDVSRLDWHLLDAPALYGTMAFGQLPMMPEPVTIPCRRCSAAGKDQAGDKCGRCFGLKRTRLPIPLQVGEQAFNDTVLEKLFGLPHARIAQNPLDPCGPGLIVFLGGDGLLMPLAR